jgi:hypothetical protein
MPVSNAWSWLKRNAIYILGGVLAILGALFAIKHERRKVASLKGQVVVARTKGKIEALRAQREKLTAGDKVLLVKERELGVKILEKEKELKEMKKKVEAMDNDEVVDEFNRLYSSD